MLTGNASGGWMSAGESDAALQTKFYTGGRAFGDQIRTCFAKASKGILLRVERR